MVGPRPNPLPNVDAGWCSDGARTPSDTPRRSFMRRRRVIGLFTAATARLGLIAGAAVAAPAASAVPKATDTSAQYEVYDVRTLAQRNAIAGTGAAIDGMEHAVVEITATGREVRALRALGFTVKAAAVETPSDAVSTLDF